MLAMGPAPRHWDRGAGCDCKVARCIHGTLHLQSCADPLCVPEPSSSCPAQDDTSAALAKSSSAKPTKPEASRGAKPKVAPPQPKASPKDPLTEEFEDLQKLFDESVEVLPIDCTRPALSVVYIPPCPLAFGSSKTTFSVPLYMPAYPLPTARPPTHSPTAIRPTRVIARQARRVVGMAVIFLCILVGVTRFAPHCWHLARSLSEPQIMLRGKDKDGSPIIIDDFREAYWWLRDNTPEDARVMAWWDYGYQINGVGNRTTIADGNTWNHEHIALLGKCLVSSENDSHAIIRHLADYVLLWTTRYAGMYSDDLAKSPHMARIAGSVYEDIDPKNFYLDQGNPSDMMAASILWRMHGLKYDPRVAPFQFYEEAYTSSNKMVRIYKVLQVSKESKDWRATQGIECSRKECYPPALQAVLQQKKSFKQIHGFSQ